MNKYGFFSSKNGDRKYSAEDFCSYFKDIFTDGILGDNTANLKVSPAGGMAIAVGAGIAYIQGHFYRPDTAERFTLAASDTSYGRKDRVVIRLDTEQRMIYPVIIAGVPAAAPSAPDIVRGGSYYDIGIAVIDVAANTAVISAADITDTRFDNAVCGVVTGAVDTIDTAALFSQYEARWDMLMAGFSGDEADIIAAFNALLTVKSVNGISPSGNGNVSLTMDDISDGSTYKKMPETIKRGTVTTALGTVGGLSGVTFADVTFDSPFSAPPSVYVTCIDPLASNQMPIAAVSNITENGFTVRTANHANNEWAIDVNWIAVGV